MSMTSMSAALGAALKNLRKIHVLREHVRLASDADHNRRTILSNEGQAAYIVPPIANIEDGPSGIDYYPGTGLNPSYAGSLFTTSIDRCDSKSDAHLGLRYAM